MSSANSELQQIGRRALFDRIWSKPMTVNAAELGTTTAMLSGLAKRLGLPLPRAGHWMKKEVGKAPPTPDYPADPAPDTIHHAIAARPARPPAAALTEGKAAAPGEAEAAMPEPASDNPPLATSIIPVAVETAVPEHKKVASTRSAIRKRRAPGRASIGGSGKFRLLVAPASGERACAILDRLIVTVEARGWSLDSTDQGYALCADGETIGFMIEEKLDAVPHVATAAELREKADYERKCALADRGIGYRPWRPPAIPEHDRVPNGALVLKFDHDYAAGGVRRTYSDGKRRRLEALIPAMIEALERWSAAVKARLEERAQWQRDWAEQERRRKDLERLTRVEGYRIAFLQAQIERKREIDGLSGLIALWEQGDEAGPEFAGLLEFARLYRTWLENRIAPVAVAARVAALKLMDDDVHIYDAKRLD